MKDSELPSGESPSDLFPAMSEGSLMANVAVFLGELIQRGTQRAVEGEAVPVEHVRVPLPFSRADGTDYLRIVALWKRYRTGTAIAAPPRACPACRSDDSQFEFVSYDQYPYHACRQCGTWFVPLAIDDQVVDAFFAAFPEARQIANHMMVGRDEGTRENDRARFGHYFRMIGGVTRSGPERLRYLDIGSGVGHSVELAGELGWDATGVEVSEVAVATARAKGRNVYLPGALASERPYDVISLFETLEHITDPDPVLADVSRRLAPAGLVVITVPNRASFEMSILRGQCFHIFGGSENVGHINLFDAHGLGALLDRHGLSLIFTDGQFSSDLLQIFSYLASTRPAALDLGGQDHIDLAISGPAYTVLNNLGPVFARLERALKRSPILIAIACRTADRAGLAAAIADLERRWRDEMHVRRDGEARTLLAHESEFWTMSAAAQQEILRREALQQEVNHRDMLLEQTQQAANLLQSKLAEAQRQINLRDGLLLDAQRQFDATLDERIRKRLRALRGPRS